jgi:hypothetical protein
VKLPGANPSPLAAGSQNAFLAPPARARTEPSVGHWFKTTSVGGFRPTCTHFLALFSNNLAAFGGWRNRCSMYCVKTLYETATMRTLSIRPTHSAVYLITFGLLTGSGFAWAQDPQDTPPADEPQQQAPAQNHGWRRVTDRPPDQASRRDDDRNQPADPQGYGLPPQLTIKPGTFVTVRINQWLSSDRNQAGDAFSASLARPIVVDGVVVAQRGQTVAGRVAEAQKAGRVTGVSRLGLQLTDLTLVDGQQVPVQTQLMNRRGPTSEGRDAVGIGATTAVGAAAGAAAGGGAGAGIGAGAGAVAGVIGVLLTRGRATVVYPESVLTFRLDSPVTISTDRAPQAFRYVEPNEYDRPYDTEARQPRSACAGYGCEPPPPPPYYYGYGGYYGPGYYPYYWGSGLSLYWGPRFYYGRGFYGRGFYGRGFRGYRR